MRNAYDIVRNKLLKAAEAQKLAFDNKVREHVQFKEHDTVLMYRPTIHSQANAPNHGQTWTSHRQGPYTVVARAYADNGAVYILRDPTSDREWTVNAYHLRPYHGRSEFLSPGRPVDEGEVQTDPVSSSVVRLPRPARRVRFQERGDTRLITVGTPGTESITASAVEGPASTLADDNHPRPLSRHRDAYRHRYGISKQEASRVHRRRLDADMDVSSHSISEEYEVESIIAHTPASKGIERSYLVRWANYDHPSQVRESQFQTSEILRDYWAQFPVDQQPRKFRSLAPMSTKRLRRK
jgi:hypothetical protein